LDFRLLTRQVASTALVLAILTSRAPGDDVYLSSPRNRQARSRIHGEVVEYTGRELIVKLAEGREIKRPGPLVVAIETEWPPGKAEADRFFDEHQFLAAREKYVAAVRKEPRAWARRAIMARVIACYRELNQLESAGKLFLALVGEDAETPYFDEIPLAWMPAEPSAALTETAQKWLKEDHPLAALLGASHVLSTLERQAALDRLTRLASEKDARLATLAQAQAWRVKIPTVSQDQLAAWQQKVETFPDALRAGPYWVLGRALAQHGQTQDALLAFLHVPILYPQGVALAADSLQNAARLMAKQGDEAAALRLRQELVARYPTSAAAIETKATLALGELSMSAPLAEGETLEQAFLAGLRVRRLFALAEHRCRQRLAETGHDDRARIELRVELSRSLLERALHETPAEREPLWSQAIEAVDQSEGFKGSRRLLLTAQQALVHLAHGELARQESELAGAAEAAVDSARQELRTAIGLLQSASKEISVELRRKNQPRRGDTGDLDAGELASLARNLDYQLARAFRNQGESYPAKSPDRANSLRQAAEKLQLLTAVDVSDSITWPARLDEIACLRLLEDFGGAAERLDMLETRQPPPAVAAALQAERIRLALDRRQGEAALAAVEQVRTSGKQPTADLDYACLEAYLAAWRAAAKANQSADAAQWQNRAADLIAEIDERYGRYWSRRAEMLLAGSVVRGGSTQNLTVLVRAAESLYRSGQIDQALDAYDRAARQAADTSQRDAAFDDAYTAAAIEQQRGRPAQAAKRFRSAALADPDNPKAGDAHLLAIYNSAQVAKHDAAALSPRAYLDLLQEHLARWPRSPTADQAHLWLAGLYENQGRWSNAIEAYQAVSPDHPQAALAIEGASRCYQRTLAALAEAGEPTREVVAQATAYFEHLVLNARGGLPERWSQTQRIAATSVAAIWLRYDDNSFARAQRLVSAALADSAEAPAEWKSAAQTLEIFAVAAQGQREQAAQLLDQISGGEPAQLLGLIEGLARVAEQAPAAVGRELAELQLRAAKLIAQRLKELPAEEQRDFQRATIRALAAAGRHDEALKTAKQLAESYPRDGQFQEEYAGLLVDSDDRAYWQAGLSKWRDIGHKTRQGSERWLRSMYYQARALTRLGESEQAARLIRVTEALYPELGGAELKAKFRDLAEPSKSRK
jgi:TolA-binding protein